MTKMSALILHPDPEVHRVHELLGRNLLFTPRDFYDLSKKLRIEFNQIIDNISSVLGKYTDWWVSPLGTRNGMISSAFLNFCYLRYAIEVSSIHNIDVIICHNKNLALALRACSEISAKVEVEPLSTSKLLRSRITPCLGWLRFARGCFLRWFFSNTTKNAKRVLDTENLRLVDVFVDEDRLVAGNFQDRYYGTFLSDTQESARWTYLPTFNLVQSYRELFRKLAENSIPFIFKENYLEIHDYLWSLLHFYRIRQIKIPKVLNQKLDITDLFQEDLKAHQFDPGAMEALLNYRFAQRLSERVIKPKLLLDWYEGQSVDKGLQLGFHRFQPQCFRVGYQGFVVTANYMCDRPTEVETNAGATPQLMAVMGNRLKANVTEFNEELPTMTAPAFRFAKASSQIPTASQPKILLIALPIGWQEIGDILSLSSSLSEIAKNAGLTVCLKPHPTTSVAQIESRNKHNFRIVKDPFEKIYDQVAVLLSNTSSILLEAILQGTPVIVIGSSTQMTHNPLPMDLPSYLWRLCFTAKEMEYSVKSLIAERWQRGPERATVTLREEFFSPISPIYNQTFAEQIIRLSEQ